MTRPGLGADPANRHGEGGGRESDRVTHPRRYDDDGDPPFPTQHRSRRRGRHVAVRRPRPFGGPSHNSSSTSPGDGPRSTFSWPAGTPFQVSVWRALATIEYGTTITYAELAREVGRPSAFRAVGQANGANPLPIFFPCHRVVAARRPGRLRRRPRREAASTGVGGLERVGTQPGMADRAEHDGLLEGVRDSALRRLREFTEAPKTLSNRSLILVEQTAWLTRAALQEESSKP